MDIITKDLLLKFIRASIDCVDDAQKEDNVVKIPKEIYDKFEKAVNDIRLRIADANGFRVVYDEESESYHYDRK